jgi:hypothetical protein
MSCPPSCVCQWVRAQGVKVTFAIAASLSECSISRYTSPVKVEVGLRTAWCRLVEAGMMMDEGILVGVELEDEVDGGGVVMGFWLLMW